MQGESLFASLLITAVILAAAVKRVTRPSKVTEREYANDVPLTGLLHFIGNAAGAGGSFPLAPRSKRLRYTNSSQPVWGEARISLHWPRFQREIEVSTNASGSPQCEQ